MHYKNFLLKIVSKLFSAEKHPRADARRILVVSTTALGDTLWATPAIESLRKSFPDAYLAVLTSPIGFEVLRTNPWIDRLHLLRHPLRLRKTLVQEQFDTVLLFHASQRLVLPLCASIGASQIVGTTGINKGLDDLLTDPEPPRYEHEIVRRLRMVGKIGGQIFTERLSFFPDNGTTTLPPGRWVALHPGSKDSFKRWPMEYFAEVGRGLKDARILITGNASERPLMEQLAAKIPGSQLADPHLSLHAFAGILNQVDLLISNDTGPVHLACALNRPVIALYASTDPVLCGPHKAPRATALFKPQACTPCLKRKCQKPFCFLQISPQEVLQAAKTARTSHFIGDSNAKMVCLPEKIGLLCPSLPSIPTPSAQS